MGFIIWIIGLVCCIWCVKDVWSKKIDTLKRCFLPLHFSHSAGLVLLFTISSLRTDSKEVLQESAL